MAAPVRTWKGFCPALVPLTWFLLILAVPAQATHGSRIRPSPQVGPPTTRITVMGQGFGPSEVVDLTFDSEPEATATTDPSGAFSAPIRVPASALPGSHVVRATGESSGLTARVLFTVRTDWPMFKFRSDHTGLNPYENVLSPANVSGLAVGWSISAPYAFTNSPAVFGGTVYAGSSGAESNLYALDASTGATRWTWTQPSTVIQSPAVWRGLVYFGTDRGVVHALDASTGAEMWTSPVGGFLSDLAVDRGVVYIGANTGYLYALDASTGAVRWSAPLEPSLTAPAVAGGVVYVASDRNGFWALDASTGAVLWTGHLGGYTNESSPAVAHGLVFVGSDDDKLYAFPAAGCGQSTCLPVWTATTGGAVESSPAVADGMVFVGSYDRYLHAFRLP